jgi:cardiolipin synthase
MTTANKITILRILLVPFFIGQVLYYVESSNEINRLLAILSFAIAALSDGVDGYIARRYGQRSELGAILDPLADKMLLVSGIGLLSLDHRGFLERLPLYLAATVFGRDIILLMGSGVIYYINKTVVIRPHWIGKVATVLQMISVLWTLLNWNKGGLKEWLHVWVVSAALCTGISGLIYVRDGVRQLSTSPSSSPSPASRLHEGK